MSLQLKNKVLFGTLSEVISPQLIKDSISRMSEVLDRIANKTVDKDDWNEFRVLKHIILEWSENSKNYLSNISEEK